MDTQSFACKDWKISGTGKDQLHNLIREMNRKRDVDTTDCGRLYIFAENSKRWIILKFMHCYFSINLLLSGRWVRRCVRPEFSQMHHPYTHRHSPFLCFSWEEHTLSSGVWQLRHYCVPHVSCAVYPLPSTGYQVAAGQLSALYSIIQRRFCPCSVFDLNIHIT